jgi:ubiquinone/menaquinone biosynthesis C-methylase UbiE
MMDEKMLKYYEKGEEATRLSEGIHRVEFERTKEVLLRYLPPPPAQVLDVGGGPGAYSFWLAEKSYTVHLIDIVPLHVEQVKTAEAGALLASIGQGDARRLDFESDSMDVVLLLGPLYHLPDRSDRIRALEETCRVLKRGGLVFCVAVSRFASLLSGLKRGFLSDPEFREIVQRDLKDGKHLNPKEVPGYFTTAYFHRPEELAEEIKEAGFSHLRTIGLQGPSWLLGDFDEQWEDLERKKIILEVLRLIEDEATLLGINAHLLALGKKE